MSQVDSISLQVYSKDSIDLQKLSLRVKHKESFEEI